LPGMDMAFVAGSALTAGLRAGLAAVAGIMVAGQVHLIAGIVGLAALLLWWPGAQQALLLAGAAYMAWIGWRIVWPPRSLPVAAPRATKRPFGPLGLASGGPAEPDPRTPLGARQLLRSAAGRAFFRAAVTCLMNPKAYAFTLAILPPFIHTAQRPVATQALWLGGIIAVNQGLVYGAVALMAAGARPWLQRSERAQRWTARGVGALLIAAAGAMVAGAAGAAPLPASPASTQPHPATDRSHAMTDTATLAPAIPVAVPDPVHDFDFLIGRWHGHNRKLRAPLTGSGAAAADWEEFDTELETSKLPDGINNGDRFTAPAWRPGYVGSTLRIYNPKTKLWGIYSFDTRGNGFDPATSALLPPVVGRFDGDDGLFEGPDEYNGRTIVVRYHWQRLGTDRARWQQSFSTDGGKTWEINWTCDHQRVR
ncbi:MAG TPA: LysE family transporter, partial [Ideonella sp.]|nr:LysE family transporter [Ideonella sp.]